MIDVNGLSAAVIVGKKNADLIVQGQIAFGFAILLMAFGGLELPIRPSAATSADDYFSF